jgi:lambda family phage portal protein
VKLPAWIGRVFTRPAAKSSGKRMYAGAKNGRLMFSAPTGSANSEIYTSLTTLRARSRALCRDVVYAKRARTVVVNNVIGQGMGMQAQVSNNRKRLMGEVNDPIESAWEQWCKADTCHTGGGLHFGDLERAVMGEVFEAGEVLIRLHRTTFGDSRIPLALELVEAERLADDYEIKPPAGASVTMGVEHDDFGRPLAYYIHRLHPREMQLTPGRKQDEILRVPAADIIHLKITERWPQTRGVPWLHAAITRLNQLGEFEEAAVIAARIGASKVGFFENPDGDMSALADGEQNGTFTAQVEAGEFTALPPGYKFTSWDPNYPNEVFDPFTRSILRGIAAGVGVSYESLSRDYSQSNYSSSRLALLDDRDLWRTVQAWWIRAFREPLHAQWLQAAVLARAAPIDLMAYANDRARFEAVKFKPRGWSWVDPTKEVAAYKEAEKAGYITKSSVIAMTGGGTDLEDVIRERRRELDMLEEADLETDTTHAEVAPSTASAPPNHEPPPDDKDAIDAHDAPDAPARVYAFKRDME